MPCILTHAAINMSSTFTNQAIDSAQLIAGSLGIIAISMIYALILQLTLPAADDSEFLAR